jgi:hypothetical protein
LRNFSSPDQPTKMKKRKQICLHKPPHLASLSKHFFFFFILSQDCSILEGAFFCLTIHSPIRIDCSLQPVIVPSHLSPFFFTLSLSHSSRLA